MARLEWFPSFAEFRQQLQEWEWPTDLTERSLSMADKVTSSRYGIVVRAVDRTHDWDDAYTYSIGSTAADSRLTLGSPSNKFNGGGAVDETATYLAAVGETIERYAGAFGHHDRQIKASFNGLIEKQISAVNPEEIDLFSPEQLEEEGFPYTSIGKDTEINWIQGYDLTNETEIFYPASLVLLSSQANDAGRKLGYSTSSGLAAHSSPLEAIIGGLNEQAERDAFSIAWYSKLALPRINPFSSKRLARFWDRYVTPSGVEVHLIDVSSINSLPTIVAVSVNEHTETAPVAFGAATKESLEEACKSASIESLQTRNWVKANQRDGDKTISLEDDLREKIVDFEDHITFYINREAAEKTRFIYQGPHKPLHADWDLQPGSSRLQVLDEMVDRVRNHNGRVLTFNLTTPDIAGCGGYVYKTIVHGFNQLDCGYSRRFLGGQRLRTRPFEMGLVNSKLEFDDFNVWPHPFP